jgi:cytochrome c oxidase assembly protein subunit 11
MTNEIDIAGRQRKNRRLAWALALVALGMIGFGYALVPIYNVMCKAFGINGKTNEAPIAYDGSDPIDKSRWVTIEFVTSRNNQMPWDFHPVVKKIRVHPGDINRVAFYAKNNSDHEMIVQAIPSVTPGLAAKHLKKTECFCFTQQMLRAGESMDMPVLFHIDRDLPQEVHEMTLSYTLFDITHMKHKKNLQAGKIS